MLLALLPLSKAVGWPSSKLLWILGNQFWTLTQGLYGNMDSLYMAPRSMQAWWLDYELNMIFYFFNQWQKPDQWLFILAKWTIPMRCNVRFPTMPPLVAQCVGDSSCKIHGSKVATPYLTLNRIVQSYYFFWKGVVPTSIQRRDFWVIIHQDLNISKSNWSHVMIFQGSYSLIQDIFHGIL